MSAFSEPVDGIIRAGPDCHQHGDPYTHCVCWRRLDADTAELVGYATEMTGHPTRRVLQDAFVVLAEMGFNRVQWMRLDPDGTERVVEFPLRRDVTNARE